MGMGTHLGNVFSGVEQTQREQEDENQNAKEINVIKELNFGLEYMLNLRRGKC